MTDFIHEAAPPENPKPAAPEKPTSEKERQKRVYAYIAVLFTVAFILILWSFLANHRSNQQVIDQLKGSTSMMQSTLEQNAKLEDEVKALETEIEEQKQAFAKAEDAYRASADRQEAIITALDWLGELERYYNAGKLNTRRRCATTDSFRFFRTIRCTPRPTATMKRLPSGTRRSQTSCSRMEWTETVDYIYFITIVR